MLDGIELNFDRAQSIPMSGRPDWTFMVISDGMFNKKIFEVHQTVLKQMRCGKFKMAKCTTLGCKVPFAKQTKTGALVMKAFYV